MTPTLLILAAGMGSRYGGLKQVERFGPSGETLMDYAIHDALRAGFSKVVFMIRHDFEAEFRKAVGGKYEERVAVEYAFQELDDLPPGFSKRADRRKPWGTTHAIWCARRAVQGPFVSLNADDYYGKSALSLVAQFLREPVLPAALPEYCVVGYPVLQTLSDHGAVARGICEVDGSDHLRSLIERKQIEKVGSTGRYWDDAGKEVVLRGDEVVSMNMFGFTPAVFEQLERHLSAFFEAQSQAPDNSESIIPVVVNALLGEGAAKVRLLRSADRWFGVTHAQDKPSTEREIAEMVRRGDYPSPIWGNG
jgi:UTP-glucose-1-phosphate uridylyltransferase